MKKSLLAIGMALATMPLTFAAQAPNAPAANNQAPAASSTTNTKKHVKKSRKAKKESTQPSAAAKPADSK